jgi:hypothetical protein
LALAEGACHAESTEKQADRRSRDGQVGCCGACPNGEPEPYFDKSRGIWVAPWRKPNGKVGRPTGKTKAAAIASRDRHVAASEQDTLCAPLAEGFTTDSTVSDLSAWWLDSIARHRVRQTSLVTYRKHLDVVGNHIGDVPVRQLRPEQVAAMISNLVDTGSASRAVNIRNVLVQVLNEAVTLGLAVDNVAQKVKRPRVTQKSKWTLTPDEIGRLLEIAAPAIGSTAVSALMSSLGVRGGVVRCELCWWRVVR